LYLAALLAIALQTPVLIWNIQHDFASFGFITGGRSGLREPLSFTGVSGYLLGATVVLGPLLLWPMLRFAFARNDGRDYSRIVFWLSSLVFLAASFFTNILIHWNVIAYAAVLPFVAVWFRPRWLLLAQLAYGALAIVVVFVNFTLLPVTSLVGPADRTSAWSYGWGEVAAAVAEERQTQPVGFIAGTNYVLASPLAFALRDPSVTSLGVSRDAYADWFSAEAHRGQDALIVADRIWGMDPRIAARFASVKKVRDVRVMRFGRAIDTYTIYLGKGFIPG
jgi:hypothetical protein